MAVFREIMVCERFHQQYVQCPSTNVIYRLALRMCDRSTGLLMVHFSGGADGWDGDLKLSFSSLENSMCVIISYVVIS